MCTDPNAHIFWLQNADARLMTLRDVEEGLVFSFLKN